MPTALKEYLNSFVVKVLENLSSVKVWFFIFPFIVSTAVLGYLVYEHVQVVKTALEALVENDKHDSLTGVLNEMNTVMNMFIAWCTFNVSLAGTIIVIRETFKVKKLIALNDEDKDNSNIIEGMNT